MDRKDIKTEKNLGDFFIQEFNFYKPLMAAISCIKATKEYFLTNQVWLEMETAPKDGQRILMKDSETEEVHIVDWRNSCEGTTTNNIRMGWCVPESYGDEQGGYFEIYKPAGWLPLPK